MPKINVDTGHDDIAKSMGREARYRGFPKDSNPFHPEVASIEHVSWDIGWELENNVFLDIYPQEGEAPPDLPPEE